MKFLDLHINGFGKFHNLDLAFSDGLNVIYGKNEAGKSTLHTFIRCMLFGMERGRGRAAKNDLYTHYDPWDQTQAYGGRLRVEHNGCVYRIERNFRTGERSFTIVDETNGREVRPTKTFMDDLLGGLSETAYLNTISIGQLKSATDAGMVAELRNYIANMNTTGNQSLNITRATDYLKNRRRQFERQLDADAAKEYANLTAEAAGIEAEVADPAYENHLRALRETRGEVRGELDKRQKEREDLLAKCAAQRQTLENAGFTDEASIEAYREDARETYAEYTEQERRCRKKSRTVGSALLFLLAVVFAAFAVYSYVAGSANPLAAFVPFRPIWLFIIAAAAACIFLYAAFDLTHETKLLNMTLAADQKVLQEIFSRNLGDSTVSEDAMDAFEKRMDEFVRICRARNEGEAACEKEGAEIDALREKERSCDTSITEQQKTQWELEQKLDRLAACHDKMETLTGRIAENERLREEIDAIDLALETLTELSQSIRNSFGLYLNKAASDMVKGITGGAYDSLSVDDGLNVYLNTPEKLAPLSQASSGTADQVYLALRLAAAQLLQKGYEPMPLIFDDSFTQYDNDRLAATLRWLVEAFEGQILLFTCHRREGQLLTQEGITYQLITI